MTLKTIGNWGCIIVGGILDLAGASNMLKRESAVYGLNKTLDPSPMDRVNQSMVEIQ